MAKKLISYDDQKPGLGLPEVVETALNDTYALKDDVPEGVVTAETAMRIVPVETGVPLPDLKGGDLVVRYTIPGNTYLADFTDTPVGSEPAGWSAPWLSGTTGVVQEDSTATDGRSLLVTAPGGRSLLQWNALSADPYAADVEVLMRWKRISGFLSAAARTSGSKGSETGVRAGQRVFNESISAEYASGDYAPLSTVPTMSTADEWAMVRLRVFGSTASFSVWMDGTPEPAGFLNTVTTSVLGAGGVGVFASSDTTAHVDWIAVATGGRRAVRP